MTSDRLADKTDSYLHRLCTEIPSRRVGSAGNRAATDLIASTVASFGFETQCPSFDCMDWSQQGVTLSAGDAPFEAFASPYSLGCRVEAPLLVISDVDELEAAEVSGEVLLLLGQIAAGQLMPKNFPFWNPEEHQRIVRALERKAPPAIIAATSRDAEMVGSQYPFPLFEDGDFDIPSVYITEEEGDRLAAHAGQGVLLESRATRIPATGCNVIARKGAGRDGRIVVFAHIDARLGTPGASDNASGTTVVLLLAELLSDYSSDLGVELVAMNGEDYYSNPGEQQWLGMNAGRFPEILLGINIDDVGYARGKTAYSLYGCPPELTEPISGVFQDHEGLVPGDPWYQGDHGLFLMNDVPALAITSASLDVLMAEYTHTPQDSPDILDAAKIVEVAVALRDLILRFSRPLG